MKKFLTVCMSMLAFCGVFSGCGSQSEQSEVSDDQKISIVTTIFPEYDWVREIMGDEAENAEITMLLDNGVDLHNYQPTADDIIKISSCEMFIYVGGESDKWVEDALAEATNKDMKVVNLMDVLGDSVREEEIIEGMEGEEHEDDEREEEEGEDHEHEEIEYDEHVWLSVNNASVLCRHIADLLCGLDEEHSDVYEANVTAYMEKLDEMDKAYQDAVEAASVKTLLFGDRFPFRYLVDDYGLDYYAAFAGCSAETEASFETIVFLADKVDELGLSKIMQVEGADGSIARTIRDNTASKDQTILTLDSMQATTMKDAQEGVSYLSIMEKNLDVLKEALA